MPSRRDIEAAYRRIAILALAFVGAIAAAVALWIRGGAWHG